MTQPQPSPAGRPSARMATLFELEYPQSVGIFDTYPDAAKAIDYLADESFPVQNLAIVGTDLKTVERVLSRKTWGSVISQGAVQGVTMGLMMSLMLYLFMPGVNWMAVLLTGLALGVGMSMLFAAVAYTATRGERDFNSVQQTVATRYEIPVLRAFARELLAAVHELRGEYDVAAKLLFQSRSRYIALEDTSRILGVEQRLSRMGITFDPVGTPRRKRSR